METKRDETPRSEQHSVTVTAARGTAWGLIGGLAGTIVMDLVLMGSLSAAGLPVLTCYSIVGNTIARFLSELGMEFTGGVPAGVAAHYLVGPLFGAIYGAMVKKAAVFDRLTMQKAVLYAILFGEVLSQPILATTPILLKMTAITTLKWYGGSFVMHLLWGVVTGIVVGSGLKMKKYSRIMYPLDQHVRLFMYRCSITSNFIRRIEK
jgi:hypothetical protein